VGDGWSIAWRVLDAQFWGVPQRRRRIALVADFGGESAPEILFVCKSLSGHFGESKPKRKETATDASRSIGADDLFQHVGADIYNLSITGDKVCSLTAGGYGSTGSSPKVITQGAAVYAVDQGGGKSACNVTEGKTSTLTCTHGGEPVVCYHPIVRRLTPLECERLQGYPDGWTDIGDWTDSKGKVHKTSDTSRYKALGNSIALPPWKWVLKRICACYERDATMASLFDGIGGFPYLWEQLNGKGTCLWASEIEEFPMAVTKVRIG
jgi:site-specific DNA-cytosine methylase